MPVFIKGQTVAKISLPLTVLLGNGSERFVCGALGCPASEATLLISATCTGGPACLAGTVSGDFAGSGTQQTYKAADLGVTFSAAYRGIADLKAAARDIRRARAARRHRR